MEEYTEYQEEETYEEPLHIPYQENKQPQPQKVVKRKASPVLIVLSTIILSLLMGMLGGYLAVRKFASGTPGSTIIHTSDETGTSKPTTVSQTGNVMTIQEVAAKATPSVVEILVEGESESYGFFGGTYQSQSAGSGVIISSDGYIITNNHVVDGGDTFKVTTYDGTEYSAQLIGADSKTDVAIIKIDATDLVATTIGDSSKIQVGDTAVVIGNPLGTLGGTVTDGIISATSREVVVNGESMELIQTNAAINSGNSGGGLFDGNGNLIGVVNAKDSGLTASGATIEGLGFAIPINAAMNVAEQLMENGKVTNRPTIGVYLQEIPENMQGYTPGLYISDIMSGSGAEKAGLKPNDRFISVDDTTINTYSDLSKYLRNKNVGDTIRIMIERKDEQLTFDVTLTGTIEETTNP